MELSKQHDKKWIVISAVNFFTGGPLTILKDCLSFLESESDIHSQYSILALVHDSKLLPQYQHIHILSVPKPKGNWLHKLSHEYMQSKKISKERDVYLWFSLHDMTPTVIAEKRAVYCHNPAPFYKPGKREMLLDKGFALFTIFYKYLYKINIKKNNFIIVQQSWIRNAFVKLFDIPESRIIVAHPGTTHQHTITSKTETDVVLFLYPALPRVFKNFDVIVDAADILKSKVNKPFRILFTIDGTENKYASYIRQVAAAKPEIELLGLQNKTGIDKLYQQCSCVLFSSKLETWGLPISEAKSYGKPILVADLPYAKETVGTYDAVSFFKPDDAQQLAELMAKFMNDELTFTGHTEEKPKEPFSESWRETFQLLLH